jgi:hypothetical protein
MRKLLCSLGMLGMLTAFIPAAGAKVVVVIRPHHRYYHHRYYHRYYRHGRWVVVYR